MRLIWLISILILMSVGCASGEPTDEASVQTPIPATDINRLEQLVTRLYTQSPGVSPQIEEAPQILVGEMPPDFGARIPDGAYIFGSVLQSDDSFLAIADLPLGQPEVEEFFKAALTDAGWREQRRPDQPGFNTSRSFPSRYCSGGDTLLYIFLRESPVENFTEARIQVQKFDNVPRVCQQDAAPEVLSSSETPELPSLSFPDGVIVSGRRRSGSLERGNAMGFDGSASASLAVTLKTDLSAPFLEEHYREQLEDLGWELLEQGAAGPVASSVWRVTTEEGEERRGLLWVVEGPGEDQRTASIAVWRPGK